MFNLGEFSCLFSLGSHPLTSRNNLFHDLLIFSQSLSLSCLSCHHWETLSRDSKRPSFCGWKRETEAWLRDLDDFVFAEENHVFLSVVFQEDPLSNQTVSDFIFYPRHPSSLWKNRSFIWLFMHHLRFHWIPLMMMPTSFSWFLWLSCHSVWKTAYLDVVFLEWIPGIPWLDFHSISPTYGIHTPDVTYSFKLWFNFNGNFEIEQGMESERE